MDSKQRRIWEEIEKRRTIYVNKWTVKIQRSLKIQVAEVVRELGERSPEQVLDSIPFIMKDAEIRGVFKILYPDVGVAFAKQQEKQMDIISDIWEEELRKYAEAEAGVRIASITGNGKILAQNVLSKLMKEEVIEQGMGIEEVAELFQKRFAQEYGKYDLWRARRIAQTEVITASNKGSHLGALHLGANTKKWLTGGMPKEIRHQGYPGLEGQTRPVNEPFNVGGWPAQFPGDPQLPPEESINCHCVCIYERI